jgi:hypothetical protein
MSEYYNREQRIPRRSSATSDAVAQRETQTGSARSTRTKDDDDEYSRSPMKPMARRLDRAPLTAPSTTQHYVIPMSDGRDLHVTERQLAHLPAAYQNAAQLITVQEAGAVLKHTPPSNAKQRPVWEDETVDDLPPASTRARGTDALPRQHRQRLPRFHWLVWVGLAMLVMLVGWYALTALGTWWQTTHDDWQYGRLRTFQIDANVGHGTASHPDSHFIAQNLNRKIIVIEIPGDDPTYARIYLGPTLIGPGEDLTPVTLSFADVNGDGKLDMIIHVSDSQFIFLNTGTGFKAALNQ